MTTIDHQQAAVRAVADALHGDACPVDPDPGESCGCGDYEREAEEALAAATPHLRAAWAAEIRAVIRDLDDARATGLVYTYGQIQEKLYALLEGGGRHEHTDPEHGDNR